MEKIMKKTNETFGDHDTLADRELDAVAGAANANNLPGHELDAIAAAIARALLPKT
jgi:hypothetical protein